MSRHRWGFSDYRAKCDHCEWLSFGKGDGMGVSAQHHDRTGHSVRIEIRQFVQYLNEEDHLCSLEDKRKQKEGANG